MNERPPDPPQAVIRQLIESFESQAQVFALVVIADVLAIALVVDRQWPNGIGEWVAAILAGIFGATIVTFGPAAIFAYFFAPYLARRWLREHRFSQSWFRGGRGFWKPTRPAARTPSRCVPRAGRRGSGKDSGELVGVSAAAPSAPGRRPPICQEWPART
jgi:hypothetical protein